jgi:hypothetical protein
VDGRITSIEISSDLIGTQTQDLLICIIVPQPTTPKLLFPNKIKIASCVIENVRLFISLSVLQEGVCESESRAPHINLGHYRSGFRVSITPPIHQFRPSDLF